MKEINQLDLFSGIGGFHLGFERAGYKVNSYFSEVDKHAVAVYKHQFKDSTYVGSVTDVRGADLPKIDLITFGSPCQDFSLAGKRKGMGGERSSLITEAIRLVHECRPRVFIWENVKGTFSSNDGADFWAIIQAFANIGGYRLEWQLLNTSWFLPQNRERIYLVGYSTTPNGDWGGVFPLGETRGADNESSKKQHNKVISPTICTNYCRLANDTPVFVEPNYTYKKVNETIEQNPNAFKEGEVMALDFYNQSVRNESPCLTDPKHNNIGVFNGYRIRRLTPIECERLQGFPDNHTSKGIYDGEVKEMSNTQRYKQCGNAVTVDVVQAIANKLHPLFEE
jgi:DNA (cytosine-5)-methyltransferase 1